MSDLERRALLGDRKAQEECTRQGILLPCPLCGARAAYWTRSSSMRDNIRGWEFGIECVKCSTKLPKSNYRISVDFTQDGGIRVCSDERESALRNWNTRPAPPVGRCGECAAYIDSKCANTGYYKSETGFCDDFAPKEGQENG